MTANGERMRENWEMKRALFCVGGQRLGVIASRKHTQNNYFVYTPSTLRYAVCLYAHLASGRRRQTCIAYRPFGRK